MKILKISDLQDGDIIISPWNTEMKVDYTEPDSISIDSYYYLEKTFEIIFSGWKVKK